jgi:hypothetical protein
MEIIQQRKHGKLGCRYLTCWFVFPFVSPFYGRFFLNFFFCFERGRLPIVVLNDNNQRRAMKQMISNGATQTMLFDLEFEAKYLASERPLCHFICYHTPTHFSVINSIKLQSNDIERVVILQ